MNEDDCGCKLASSSITIRVIGISVRYRFNNILPSLVATLVVVWLLLQDNRILSCRPGANWIIRELVRKVVKTSAVIVVDYTACNSESVIKAGARNGFAGEELQKMSSRVQ